MYYCRTPDAGLVGAVAEIVVVIAMPHRIKPCAVVFHWNAWQGETTPRMTAGDGAWAVLATHQPMQEVLKALDGTAPTPERLAAFLTVHGFENIRKGVPE